MQHNRSGADGGVPREPGHHKHDPADKPVKRLKIARLVMKNIYDPKHYARQAGQVEQKLGGHDL